METAAIGTGRKTGSAGARRNERDKDGVSTVELKSPTEQFEDQRRNRTLWDRPGHARPVSSGAHS
eukprot:8369608-Pyramimonas_sp.AAC.1